MGFKGVGFDSRYEGIKGSTRLNDTLLVLTVLGKF
jgi:hypothetical protein